MVARPKLDTLPVDVLLTISDHVSPRDLISAALCSRSMHHNLATALERRHSRFKQCNCIIISTHPVKNLPDTIRHFDSPISCLYEINQNPWLIWYTTKLIFNDPATDHYSSSGSAYQPTPYENETDERELWLLMETDGFRRLRVSLPLLVDKPELCDLSKPNTCYMFVLALLENVSHLTLLSYIHHEYSNWIDAAIQPQQKRGIIDSINPWPSKPQQTCFKKLRTVEVLNLHLQRDITMYYAWTHLPSIQTWINHNTSQHPLTADTMLYGERSQNTLLNYEVTDGSVIGPAVAMPLNFFTGIRHVTIHTNASMASHGGWWYASSLTSTLQENSAKSLESLTIFLDYVPGDSKPELTALKKLKRLRLPLHFIPESFAPRNSDGKRLPIKLHGFIPASLELLEIDTLPVWDGKSAREELIFDDVELCPKLRFIKISSERVIVRTLPNGCSVVLCPLPRPDRDRYHWHTEAGLVEYRPGFYKE